MEKLKLKPKNKTKVRENINKKYDLSPLASSNLVRNVKLNIQIKKLNNLLIKYGLSIISLKQITDLVAALEDVVARHEQKIADKTNGGNKNAPR
jgi:hypothetical protein